VTDDDDDATNYFDPNDFNQTVIEEFRVNEGKVGGMFEGRTMLLLHSTGAKSGHARIARLVYRPVGEAWAIFASKGGAPTNPDWYYNLTANPAATIEVGTATVPVVARVWPRATNATASGNSRSRTCSVSPTTRRPPSAPSRWSFSNGPDRPPGGVTPFAPDLDPSPTSQRSAPTAHSSRREQRRRGSP